MPNTTAYKFGIYSANIANPSSIRMLAGSPTKELTHPAVSPDWSRVAFVRYHYKGVDGDIFAEESDGYSQTEIVSTSILGKNTFSVVSPVFPYINTNPTWHPWGNVIYFISTQTALVNSSIKLVYTDGPLKSIAVPIAAPAATPNQSDPAITRNGLWISFSQKGNSQATFSANVDNVWLMVSDNSLSAQMTFSNATHYAGNTPGAFAYGDYDTKLNPVYNEIAFMRSHGLDANGYPIFRIISVNTDTLIETALTSYGNTYTTGVDTVPEWSADGNTIVYIHWNFYNFPESGIYTMSRTGTNKTKIPFPKGFWYNHPKFYPNSNSMIVFSAEWVPALLTL